jgi:hypothetical protein
LALLLLPPPPLLALALQHGQGGQASVAGRLSPRQENALW